MPFDTPARAARAVRPQTRAWKRLLSEANEQTTNSLEIRAQLRRHLQAADRLSAKRTSPKPSLDVLNSVTTDWNSRVQALGALREDPNSFDVRPIVPLLVIQLGELRSAVVVAAAAAIASVSAQRLFSAEQAKEIFVAAADGVNVSKKVMANARRQAALAVLHAQTDEIVFEGVAGVVSSAHASARILVVDAFIEIVDNAQGITQVEAYVLRVLGRVALDRNSDVREAARKLKGAFEKRFGEDECTKILKRLPEEAGRRLGGGSGIGGARGTVISSTVNRQRNKALVIGKGKNSNIKDLIRARRKAMKNQTPSGKQGDEGIANSHFKQSVAGGEWSELPSSEKVALMTPDKENRPNPSLSP